MTEILLGPTMTDGPTTKVKDKSSGKIYYRKQILPEGQYKYKTAAGEDVDLDLSAAQLNTFVDSFKKGAYDEVPFQIGHGDDKDLKSRKGTLAQVEYVKGKGIDGYFALEDDAAQYVEKYPKFGVSPRIVLGINRMDGKKFIGAIQHVAGTVVPRATGMSPWSKVELSEEGDTNAETPVLDLSSETIKAHVDVKENKVTKTTGTGSGGDGDQTFTLSQEDYDFFQNMKREYAEAERILGEPGKVTGEMTVDPSTSQKIDLSEVTGKADKALAEIAQMRAAAAKETWIARKQLLLSQGVPPAALDLADPVMTSVDSQVYDLATDEGVVKVDAKTQMLGQLELMKGMVDLSGEKGHGIAGVGADDASADEISAWMQANGI